MDNDIDRACYFLVEPIFEGFGNFVRVGYIQARVNEDVQVEKDFSSDHSRSQFVPMSDPFVGINYLSYMVDCFAVDGRLSEFTEAVADYLCGHKDNHQTYRNGGYLVTIYEAHAKSDKTYHHGHRTQGIGAMVPGVCIQGGAVRFNGDGPGDAIKQLFNDNRGDGNPKDNDAGFYGFAGGDTGCRAVYHSGPNNGQSHADKGGCKGFDSPMAVWVFFVGLL
jgi:hypothetical protein